MRRALSLVVALLTSGVVSAQMPDPNPHAFDEMRLTAMSSATVARYTVSRGRQNSGTGATRGSATCR